jgi:hypothetical protein
MIPAALREIRKYGDLDWFSAQMPQEVRMKKIFYFTLLLFCAAILMSIGIPMNSSRAAEGTTITIAYSSNMMGYLEPCG